MKKQIALSLIGIVVVAGGVAGMSAYEAHVINVTAHVENALKVLPITGELEFGTVFPQEYRAKSIVITTSESFCESSQRRVLNIDYKIVQKPKCINEAGEYAPVDYATHSCPEGYKEMPSLCPYLSKTPVNQGETESGVLAFHDPDDPAFVATGTLNKDNDLSDDWVIDLVVPCFEGFCSQDWPDFVRSYNPDADPSAFMLPAELESSTFGCDLWVEVTNIY